MPKEVSGCGDQEGQASRDRDGAGCGGDPDRLPPLLEGGGHRLSPGAPAARGGVPAEDRRGARGIAGEGGRPPVPRVRCGSDRPRGPLPSRDVRRHHEDLPRPGGGHDRLSGDVHGGGRPGPAMAGPGALRERQRHDRPLSIRGGLAGSPASLEALCSLAHDPRGRGPPPLPTRPGHPSPPLSREGLRSRGGGAGSLSRTERDGSNCLACSVLDGPADRRRRAARSCLYAWSPRRRSRFSAPG